MNGDDRTPVMRRWGQFLLLAVAGIVADARGDESPVGQLPRVSPAVAEEPAGVVAVSDRPAAPRTLPEILQAWQQRNAGRAGLRMQYTLVEADLVFEVDRHAEGTLQWEQPDRLSWTLTPVKTVRRDTGRETPVRRAESSGYLRLQQGTADEATAHSPLHGLGPLLLGPAVADLSAYEVELLTAGKAEWVLKWRPREEKKSRLRNPLGGRWTWNTAPFDTALVVLDQETLLVRSVQTEKTSFQEGKRVRLYRFTQVTEVSPEEAE